MSPPVHNSGPAPVGATRGPGSATTGIGVGSSCVAHN